MKKLSLAVTMMLGVLVSLPSQAAGSASANFSVVINFTGSCSVTTPTDITMSYTDNQGTSTSGSTSANITCTNNMPYTASLGPSYSFTGSTTSLPYTMTLNGSGTDASLTGNGSAQAITIGAAIAANQVGSCGSGTCTDTDAHTLTITY
jgi:spore coat protein U-like protein